MPTSKIDSAFGNVGLKDMFKDPDGLAGPLKAAICNETATIQQFGFLVSTNCGYHDPQGQLHRWPVQLIQPSHSTDSLKGTHHIMQPKFKRLIFGASALAVAAGGLLVTNSPAQAAPGDPAEGR